MAKKKAKKNIPVGKAYVYASYNNTIVTLTDPNGDVIAWSSAGSSGFKGTRKATPYAAQVAAENAVTKAKLIGLEKVDVYIKGIGTGREQALRGLQSSGLQLESITDCTPIPHNGCRARKTRRG
ncbi:30S ribosomal protein S11 [Candidatus Peregrinibacteria bacterium RIFOXYC2_FULL_33_13]|nr:MAG: 30S ribosomal protein S11 [Candidatus Peregrinibacteria bacterium GW2011_GWA2_33_10]KKP39912.1 MAG: 30S ribosomal protein S11, small subunit ribosomal protein S11 [Candidatus Peregrinibacteria bacterium GW2011_GWC2_33_13]OGJ54315.1 MAG: 30S ribosomal protein S11 [Candidatus Peregrinibacteria bacterium RIFOXYC2_FULL_33_13]